MDIKVGIIGAGRAGCALAIGLKAKGFDMGGVCSRSRESAAWLNKKLEMNLTNDLLQTVQNSNVIFISVQDGAIGETAKKAASVCGGAVIKGKVFLHCSGSLASDELSPLANEGGMTGSLHPVQTFADRENGWKGLDGIYFGFEGCNEAKRVSEEIVKAFGGNMIIVDKEDKAVYHAAACVISNYTVALSYMAGKLLGKTGIDERKGVEALMPLLENTVRNIKLSGSEKALTGPVSRGDYHTVGRHVDAIKVKAPEYLKVYEELGKLSVELSLKRGSIDSGIAEKLLNKLGS
ncbi:MAG: DUF2520 domain-containing protein [Clostridia bacterium]|nr:DUF2520 domain-containing protein [Clostridia bacterium]